jgi:hypothetical protein
MVGLEHRDRDDPSVTHTGERGQKGGFMHSSQRADRTIRNFLRSALLSTLALLLSCSSGRENDLRFTVTAGELQALKLCYYSDYFSFIGSDQAGRVAFALDNNRGRDGDSWQAEHFAVLHDEKTGWQAVAGSGPYYNVTRETETIPNSPHFQFEGTAGSGLVVRSKPNALVLTIAPMKNQIAEKRGLAEYRLGSAEATLAWRGRRLEGRVIYEYLFVPAFNRLTRNYPGEFRDFHGIYASIQNVGDLYIHTQKSTFFSPLIARQEGFLFLNGQGYRLSSLDVDVRAASFAPGFYRWPAGWEGSFVAGPGHYAFAGRITDRKTISSWVTGGFAMGIVKGTLISAHETWTLYGLGELII